MGERHVTHDVANARRAEALAWQALQHNLCHGLGTDTRTPRTTDVKRTYQRVMGVAKEVYVAPAIALELSEGIAAIIATGCQVVHMQCDGEKGPDEHCKNQHRQLSSGGAATLGAEDTGTLGTSASSADASDPQSPYSAAVVSSAPSPPLMTVGTDEST